MNRGPLNGFALNGRMSDPVVRVRVDAKGYARVRSGGRVLSYAVVHTAPEARQMGIGGRVQAQLQVAAAARAALVGALGRVDVRALLQATGRAVVHVELPPVYGRVHATGRAQAQAAAHVLMRAGAQARARARFAPATRLARRGPVRASPEASIHADGVIYARRWLRMPADGRAVAFVVSRNHVEARLSVLAQAVAGGHALARIQVRAPVAWSAVAHIVIDPAIHKRLPFDEPAPGHRTFMVPASVREFYVME